MTAKENPGRRKSTEACREQLITTAGLSNEGEDGPVSLSEMLKRPEPTPEERKQMLEDDAREQAEAEAYSNEYDEAAERAYINQVTRNWNERDRRLVAYAEHVLAEVDRLKDKIDGKEKWWLKAKELKGLLEYPSIGSAANDKHPEFRLSMPDQIIEGVLHAGCKLVLGGPSKSYKTWNLTALGFAVATGTKWMNHFQCAERKVLYLNYELIPPVFQERRILIHEAMGLKTSEVGNFHFWELKGYAGDIADFLPHLVSTVENGNYGLVIIDPIYKVYGDRDENKASDVGAIVNALDKVCTQSGAAIAFGAHFPKGDMSSRKAMDRIAGSGVFARDPEAIITISDVPPVKLPDDPKDLSPEDEERIKRISTGHFREVELGLRNFKESPTFIIEWDFPLFSVSDALEPESVKKIKEAIKAAKKTKKHTARINEVLEWFRDNPAPEGVSTTDAMKYTGIADRNAFSGITEKLEAAGFIKRKNTRSPWNLTGKTGDYEEAGE